MSKRKRLHLAYLAALATLHLSFSALDAAKPTADQALRLRPIQSGVDFDMPSAEESAKCTVESKSEAEAAGWIVYAPSGRVLRRFVDTNGDNKLDQWCYYKIGIEVYRDIDADFDGKADQYRWLGPAGTRWGDDSDQDGKIDSWRAISAEEVTEELVESLRSKDSGRFQRLLLTPTAVKALGLGEVQEAEVGKLINAASSGFDALAAQQQVVSAETKWLSFGASRPGVVPKGFQGSTKDAVVYDNVSTIVETDGQPVQIVVGSLVQTDRGWRLFDLPKNLLDNQPETLAGGFFFQEIASQQTQMPTAEGGLSEAVQKLIGQMEQLDRQIEAESEPTKLAQLHASRADVLEQLIRNATTGEEQSTWIKQFADTVSVATQSGGYPDGLTRLKQLADNLSANKQLQAFVTFRYLSAEYGNALQQPSADFEKIQEKWLADLQQFVKDFPTAEDAPEAMLQLGIGQEFAGSIDDAVAWYGKVVADFSESPVAQKAAGAKRRLESVGKAINLQGPTLDGKTLSLDAYTNRTVLIHYWATWCEPCKEEFQTLKAMQAKYAQQGFALVGVNLDSDPASATTYLQANPLPWPQVHEAGGLDSRLAVEMGILTLPTMLLVDGNGRVLNRNIHAGELDEELGKRLR